MIKRAIFWDSGGEEIEVASFNRNGKTYYGVYNQYAWEADSVGRFAITHKESGIDSYLLGIPVAKNQRGLDAVVKSGYKRLYVTGPDITSARIALDVMDKLLEAYEGEWQKLYKNHEDAITVRISGPDKHLIQSLHRS